MHFRPGAVKSCCSFDCSGITSLFRSSFPKPALEAETSARRDTSVRQYLNESLLSEDQDVLPISKNLLFTVRDVKTLNSELTKALDSVDSLRVKSILELGANPNFTHSSKKETPLMSACFNNDADSVKYLLNAQADPNLRGDTSNTLSTVTPLMIAAENGMTECVSELLRCKADPHTRNHNGETALLAAARTNNHDAFAVLVGSMVSDQ